MTQDEQEKETVIDASSRWARTYIEVPTDQSDTAKTGDMCFIPLPLPDDHPDGTR
jgi:hypothetical protein